MSPFQTLSFDLPDSGEKGDCPSEFCIFRLGNNETTKGDYEFDEESAAAVMRNAASYGNKLTIDYEHQALSDPPVKAPAAGRYSLEMRDDGLYAVNVQWTPDAKKHLSDKEYLYYSPAFLKDEKGRPSRLLNVALTNLPATKNMTALVAASQTFSETPMKTVLLALNLKDGASEAEALSAVTSLNRQSDEIVKLTGKASLAEAVGVIAAWKESAGEAVALKARLDKQELDAKSQAFDAAIDAAKKSALLALSDDHKRNKAALAFKANGGIESLNSFLSALDPLVVVAGARAEGEPKPVESAVVILTAKEKEIAHKMGIDEKLVLANKVRRASLTPVPVTDDEEDAA